MPVIVRMEFEDGTDSVARFPAEIWRFNDVSISKVIATNKKVKQWTLDPFYEIADINTEDNSFPPVAQPTRFQLFKQQQRGGGSWTKPNAATTAAVTSQTGYWQKLMNPTNLQQTMRKVVLLASLTLWSAALLAQAPAAPTQSANTRFEQLGPTLPTPNTFRTASGAPGKDYFQNRADYDIKVELDDANQKIIGSETVTYHNNSTDELPFIWLQLDQNLFAKGSIGSVTRTGGVNESGMSFAQLQNLNSPFGNEQQQTPINMVTKSRRLKMPNRARR